MTRTRVRGETRNPRLPRDPRRVAPQRLDVEPPVVEEIAPERLGLLLAANVRSGAGELALESPRDALHGDEDGLVGAEHGVVERLAVDDVGGRALEVRGCVDVDRGVARSHPDGGVRRRVGGPHHRHPARREDDVGPVGSHELLDERQARLLDHLHRAIRRAGLERGLGEGLRRVDAAGAGRGMRADDDGVARHERAEHLEVDGGDRVGGGHEGEDDAGRPRDPHDPRPLVAVGVDEVPVR